MLTRLNQVMKLNETRMATMCQRSQVARAGAAVRGDGAEAVVWLMLGRA